MMQTYKKKLIEVSMPLEIINTASMKEKINPFLKGHPRALHQWWARRPLPACRAILFAQLVDDPSNFPEQFPTESDIIGERNRLFNIIEELVEWNNSSNLEVLKKATDEIMKSSSGILPSVLDPFSGGGAIPFEAQRLGLHTIASDLNPVANLIAKGMIDYPTRFSGRQPMHGGIRENQIYQRADGLSEDIKYYGKVLQNLAEARIGKFYPKIQTESGSKLRVSAWIWARTVPSPDPAFQGSHVPLVTSFLLSRKKGKEAFIVPEIDRKNKEITFNVCHSASKELMNKAAQGTKNGRGANFVCLLSNSPITSDYVKECGHRGEIGSKLMAVVAEGNRKKFYISPTIDQEKVEANIEHQDLNSIPLPKHPQYIGVLGYGMTKFSDLFSARQSLCLSELIELLPDVMMRVRQDIVVNKNVIGELGEEEIAHYIKAINLYLGFVIDKLADFNNAHCGWNAANENISHMFGRHAIPMVWDYVETNPFGGMMGLDSICKSIAGGLTNAGFGTVGDVQNASAQTVQAGVDKVLISTDPPYYDNIPYADISDFFYGLLRKSQKSYFSDIVVTLSAPKSEELVADRVRYGGANAAEAFFLKGMTQTMINLYDQASEDYPITIYYAFKQNEIENEGVASTGWATFLQSVFNANLSVVGTWPVRTENSVRRRASRSNALANSVVLVCRKKKHDAEVTTRAEFIRELQIEIPQAVHSLQSSNIAPADMPQSAIGPGMGVFSRYKMVLEADDTPMTVKTALQLINTLLDESLNDLHGDFDPETRFAATWFEQNGYEKGDFGAANSLSMARGIAVESVKHAGIVDSSAGKVRIFKREELDPNWDPNSDTHVTIWECCQYLVREYEEGGETAAAMLVKKMGFEKADSVKDLAYYLYDICSNKRQDAKEATSYNALIAGWSDIMRMANSISDTDTTRQASLF